MAETRTPAQVADEIAEAVRTLVYMTGAGGAVELESPADLYAVLGGLSTAADRLPQAFGQMARWIREQHAAGRVGHDQGAAVSEYVEAVADALGRASDDAVAMRAALDSAHEMNSGLTGAE